MDWSNPPSVRQRSDPRLKRRRVIHVAVKAMNGSDRLIVAALTANVELHRQRHAAQAARHPDAADLHVDRVRPRFAPDGRRAKVRPEVHRIKAG